MEPMGPGAQEDQWGPMAPLANRISTTTPKSRGIGGSLAYTSLLAWVELNLSLLTSLPLSRRPFKLKRVPVCLALQIQCSIDTLVQCNSKKTIATRFPFLCQDRFFLRCFGGSKTGPKNGTKKGSQNGPQMDPKRDPRGTKMGLKTGSRKGSRKGYPSGRVNSEILLLFTVFQQGRAS